MAVHIEGIGTLTNPVIDAELTPTAGAPVRSASARRRPATRTSAWSAPACSTGPSPGTPAARSSSAIEDTDAARDSEESYQQLLDALRWLGLDWDEGPEVGGPHGPYRQSERRRHLRATSPRKLLAAGHLYESLLHRRGDRGARTLAAGPDPKLGYDNFDRDLTDAQQRGVPRRGPRAGAAAADARRGPQLDRPGARRRHASPPGSVPDFVLVRANGDPLYTLVNPVDDALMGITHVLRGEDLLPSTPRQIALYRALVDIGVADRRPRVRPPAAT